MTWKRPWMGGTILVAGVIASAMVFSPATRAQNATQDDVEPTRDGPITIRPLVHGSVLLQFQEKNYYIDPSQSYNWASLPKADLILVTHEHGDHLNPSVIAQIRKDGTQIIANEASAKNLPGAIVMRNGDRREILGVTVEAVPAYNVVRTQ
jgi:L-ascorbate metabolism protein UlaG (beta-lactamase superfamily)